MLIPVVGVLLLGQAIASFINGAVNFIVTNRFEGMDSAEHPLRRLIGVAVQVAFAIYIIARPERLLEFLQRRGTP